MNRFATLLIAVACWGGVGQSPALASELARSAAAGSSSTPARNVEVDLTASVVRLPLVPGIMTEVYAYNGQVPGPVLEFREGDRVTVHFRNALPVPTTVHWHGLHLPFISDGSPFHPVGPGEAFEYSFTVQPGTAGTYWYHPHPDHQTGQQIARGLYGGIIVHAADDPLPPMAEKLLILSDNRFLDDGALDLPDMHSPQGRTDFENGREGEVLFVNGKVMPELTIRSGEMQRWRVINASAGRYYRLSIPGHTMLHVGSDGGLFERPVGVSEILLASAERVEIIVRGTGKPGTTAVLQSLPYDRYIPQTRPPGWDKPRDLLRLRYSDQPATAPVALATALRPVAALDPAQATATREVVFSQGMINGKLMDMSRVDVSTRLGATEIWQIENVVGMDHPFHMHGFQFQVLDRDGVPETFPSWKDTVNVPKHQSVRIIVRYDDYPGMWMFHCHILNHEDHGMMGILEVK